VCRIDFNVLSLQQLSQLRQQQTLATLSICWGQPRRNSEKFAYFALFCAALTICCILDATLREKIFTYGENRILRLPTVKRVGALTLREVLY